MTQHLDVEELQNLLRRWLTKQPLLRKHSQVKQVKFCQNTLLKNADIKLSTSERAALQKEIKKLSLRAIIVKVRVLLAIVRQLKMSKTIGR